MTAAIKSSLAALVIGLVVGWLVNGWRLGETIEEMNANHARELIDSYEAAKEREDALYAENATLQEHLRKEKSDAKKQIAIRDTAIDAGRLRLSVIARGACTDSPAESGQARTELEPTFAKSLFAITDDGDAAIRELNTCIDAYGALRGKN